jgi:hypothetical protein
MLPNSDPYFIIRAGNYHDGARCREARFATHLWPHPDMPLDSRVGQSAHALFRCDCARYELDTATLRLKPEEMLARICLGLAFSQASGETGLPFSPPSFQRRRRPRHTKQSLDINLGGLPRRRRPVRPVAGRQTPTEIRRRVPVIHRARQKPLLPSSNRHTC